ncbi:dynein regulatory complex protein 10 isoform 1-T2 [Odontesthes bonariensis]|uniref:dynein regulatory complex protein 10 n=1 Tax=Odontesthes bonariensis TaxID=219752 RepID=UPI003F58BEC6
MSAKETTLMAEGQSEVALLLQKKKLSLEAQRISSIVEKCISKVEIAAALPDTSGVVDNDLSRALQAHQIISEKLEKLEGLKHKSDGHQEGEAEEARKRERAQLEKDIKSSVRNVLRHFRVNPNAFTGIRAELDVEVGDSESILIRELKIFHSHMIKRLSCLHEEPQPVLSKRLSSTSVQSLEHLISQEEKAAATIKEMNETISEREREIKNMQDYLENAHREDLTTLPEKQAELNMKTSSMRLASLQQEIDELNIQLNSLRLENRQAERILHEKNEMLEMEIENLIQTFDREMEETQTKLELNESEHEKEQEEVKKLENPFSVLEVEFNQIQEKRRLNEEKRREEMRELELKTKASILIQAWWRGYSIRKALKNKGKRKKGKKGKGKKTK